MFKDYYAILGIFQQATDVEIRNAFKEQAKKWHPDKNKGIDTTSKMQDINEAYFILKDKEKRARYDIEYNLFKKQQNSKKENSYNEQNNSDYTYYSYAMQDDILKQWMQNARAQSVEIVKQAIKDTKGISIVVAQGCVTGIVNVIIYAIVLYLIVMLLYFIFA